MHNWPGPASTCIYTVTLEMIESAWLGMILGLLSVWRTANEEISHWEFELWTQQAFHGTFLHTYHITQMHTFKTREQNQDSYHSVFAKEGIRNFCCAWLFSTLANSPRILSGSALAPATVPDDVLLGSEVTARVQNKQERRWTQFISEWINPDRAEQRCFFENLPMHAYIHIPVYTQIDKSATNCSNIINKHTRL